jgi:hypothetical protein
MFCRDTPLNISCIVLELHIIGGELIVWLLQCLQFPSYYCHVIWVPECCFQNCYQCWHICQVDAVISNIAFDLGKSLAHMEFKGVLKLVLGVGEMGGITYQLPA